MKDCEKFSPSFSSTFVIEPAVLAEPENDSISSSDDDELETVGKSKTLPASNNKSNSSRSNLIKIGKKKNGKRRAFTLPRNPLASLTNKNRSSNSSTSSSGQSSSKKAKMASKSELVEKFNKLVETIAIKSRDKSSVIIGTNGGCFAGGNNGHDAMLEERIQNWKRRFLDEDRVPGVVGIRNHGNTCFINAILQCLSYTDILAEVKKIYIFI